MNMPASIWSPGSSSMAGITPVNNVAELLQLDSKKVKFVGTAGYYLPGDGGAAFYYYDSTDTTSPSNHGSVQVAVDGARWKIYFQTEYNLKQFGCKGDWDGLTGTDDTIQAQACINAAMAAKYSILAPSGYYKITSQLVIDNSTSVSYVDRHKVDFRGEGTHVTGFQVVGFAESAIKVIGGQGVGAIPGQCFEQIRDFRVSGQLVNGSFGIWLDTTQHISLSNVEIEGFDLGLYQLDVDFANFTKVIVHWNKRGMLAEERSPRSINSTRPNGINYTSCQWGGNSQYGGTWNGGGNVNIYGGDVEGNGIGGSGNTWGLLFNGMGVQSGVGCNLDGVYFEHNKGVADVWVIANTAPAVGLNPPHCVHVVKSCSFNRVSGVDFTTTNILASFDKSVAGKQKLVVRDSSFKGYNNYIPTAGREYIQFAGDARSSGNALIEGCIMQDDIETVPQNDYYNCSLGLAALTPTVSAVLLDLVFTTENYDSDGMHTPGAVGIVAPVTGKYLVTSALYWAANATGVRSCLIIKNTGTAVEIAGSTMAASSSGRTRQSVSIEVMLNKGDQISLRAFQDSGVALNIDNLGTTLTLRSLPY